MLHENRERKVLSANHSKGTDLNGQWRRVVMNRFAEGGSVMRG